MTESAGQERWGSPLDGAGQEQDAVIGTPETDVETWDGQQSDPDTCAVRCQEFIIEQFTGMEVEEATLVQQAQEMGWYFPGEGGTPPEATGNLLELYGIPVQQYEKANAYDLATELAQGHKVIIGVDSGELAGGDQPILEDIAGYADTDGADHAIVVSGIDTTDPNNPQVIISDPGTGEAEARYPLDQFLAAWQDSDFFMAATQVPAPPTASEMANFDYEAGHIPEVLGTSYGELSYDDVMTQLDTMVITELTQTNRLIDQSDQVLDASAPVVNQYDPNIPINPGDGVITREETDEIAGDYSNPYDKNPDYQPGYPQAFYDPPPNLVPEPGDEAEEEA